MTINTVSCTLPGIYHASRNKSNEDFVLKFENDMVYVVAIADGCSSSAYACIASEASCKAAINFSQNSRIWDMKPKQLKSEFIKYIDQTYFDTESPYSELLSTIAVLVINKVSSQYIALSIGDCSMLVIDQKLETPEILFNPLNLLSKDSTIFANSNGAQSLMQINTGTVDNIAGFTLFSDGADILLDKSSSETIVRLAGLTAIASDIAAQELEGACMEIRDSGHDDVSVIQLIIDNPVTCKIASAMYPEAVQYSGYDENMIQEDTVYDEYDSRTDECKTAVTIPVESDEKDTSKNTLNEETESASSLLDFLSTPKNPQEIIDAGFTCESELLVFLRPYLRDKLVTYMNHTFIAKQRRTL